LTATTASLDTTTSRQQQLDLKPWQHGAIFLFACLIVVTRRPDAVFHAQFWAEDGWVFYQDAYNFGAWPALFRAYAGYFQILPRLGASIALLVPLTVAPLVLNLIAIAVQALPANLLISNRSSGWGSLRYRAVLAGVFLALPNCGEVEATICNSQTLLALIAFLLLVAAKPRSVAGRVFDVSMVLLCGFTGPFCIFLLPIALYVAWQRRCRWNWAVTSLLALSCLVQAWGLLIVNPTGRSQYAPLGANPAQFARILAGQVYLGALLGGNRLAALPGRGLFTFLVCSSIVGTSIVVICLANSEVEMKLFLLFSSMLFAASLISPMASPPIGLSRWDAIAMQFGIRYWYFPTLAFAWSLLWGLKSRKPGFRVVSAVLLIVMCFGIIRDWRCPVYSDLHFAEYANRFKAAPSGSPFTIPLNPEGWNLRLVKH
jgi:hypothetical protein